MNSKIEAFVKNKLATNQAWVERALVKLLDCQTIQEQSRLATIEENGVGFNANDAEFLTSLAENIKTYNHLTSKQLVYAHKYVPKYWRQIWNMIPEDKKQKIIAELGIENNKSIDIVPIATPKIDKVETVEVVIEPPQQQEINIVKEAIKETFKELHSRESLTSLVEKIESECSVKFLQSFQKEETINLLYNFANNLNAALIAPVGCGKTYIYCFVLKALEELNWFDDNNAPFKWLIVTAATGVEQTDEVIRKEFKFKTGFVTNYDFLRSTLGAMFLKWETRMIHGQPDLIPVWHDQTAPKLIIWDECQALRHANSLRSKCACGYFKRNELELMKPREHRKAYFSLFSSATPFVRPIEVRQVALGLRSNVDIDYWRKDLVIDEKLWPSFLWTCSYHPDDYNPTGLKKTVENLEKYHKYFFIPKNIRFKKKAKINQYLATLTVEKQEMYNVAYEEYLEVKRKLDADYNEPGGIFALWVAMGKFKQKAELLRADDLAKLAKESIDNGKAPIVGCCYVETLENVKAHLEKMGVNRISVIRGNMTRNARHESKKAFQNGETDVCLIMTQAGGVALSLHHDKETLKPREVFVPPVWNAIELLQVLGRAHRINSLSDTIQNIVWYAGTIEERVAEKVAKKCKCIREIVGKKASWANAFNDMADEDNERLTQKMIEEESYNDDESNEVDEEYASEMIENE